MSDCATLIELIRLCSPKLEVANTRYAYVVDASREYIYDASPRLSIASRVSGRCLCCNAVVRGAKRSHCQPQNAPNEEAPTRVPSIHALCGLDFLDSYVCILLCSKDLPSFSVEGSPVDWRVVIMGRTVVVAFERVIS